MAKVQFVECKFRASDKRGYTYKNEGSPVRVGDEVKVPDKDGDGWNRVTVSAIDLPEPRFQCKPVLGLYDGADRDAAILAKVPEPKPVKVDPFGPLL